MIGVLRPQPSSSGSRSKANAYVEEQISDGVLRQLASPAAQQDPGNGGGFLAVQLPPRPQGAYERESYRSNNELALTHRSEGQLAVTAIESAGDVHEIKELNDSSAEVGALCVAVVRQSLKHASREIWGMTRGAAAAATKNRSMLVGGPTGVSYVSAAAGGFRALLRRYAQAFVPHGSEGRHDDSGACLVLYFKLAGGVIMASPLDGPAFRLRQHPIVEDKEALTREICWTLPSGGFEALLDLENSVVPGLPALARDMAKDERLAAKLGYGPTSLAEEISTQFCDDGDGNRTQHIVLPRVAGIIFASLAPAAAPTTSRGSTSVGSSGAAVRVSAVVARLEQEDGTVMHRFVLEDFDVLCSDGAEEGTRGNRRRKKRKRTKTRVSLPTSYAALMDEATSPCRSPGPSIAARILGRWRRGHKYRAGVNQVVPGVGEVPLLEEEEQQQPFVGAGQPTRLEKEFTSHGEVDERSKSAETATRAGEAEQGGQSRTFGGRLLSVADVMSASSSQAALWASTRDVIWAMLATACRQEVSSCGGPETRRSTAAPTEASCAGSRRAACALLARVFGSVTAAGEEKTGEEVTWISGEGASTALDWWYEGFRSATAPPCHGGGIGGGFSLLLQEEAPRLLLEEMLEIPALKAAFVKRGLTRHLANALRAGSLEMRSREKCLSHRSRIRYPPDGGAPPCGANKLRENDDPDVSCASVAGKSGGRTRPRNAAADGDAYLPWWLIFSHGRGETWGGGHGQHGFSSELGGSADGVGAEVDGRSCQTALDEIFAPGRGQEERGADTSREDSGPTDGNSLGSAGETMPVIARAKRRERWEREEGVGGRAAGGGASSTKMERVAPPMLRLDALSSILDTEECASARLCSPHAVACLSAASTRAASEHLPTLLSARGVTSRASARHGSGRSARTGYTTQRDSTASTGCPTVRSTSPSVPVDPEVAAAPPPLSPPPSSCYSDGEPVSCREGGDAGASSCGGAVVTGPWSSGPDDEAANAGSVSAAKARDGNSEGIVINDSSSVLRPGGDAAAEVVAPPAPLRQGEGRGSGREGMPRLHLEGLPANEAGRASNANGPVSGGSAGGTSPPATNTGQSYVIESEPVRQPPGGGTAHESATCPDRSEVVSRAASPQSTDGSSASGEVRRSGKRVPPDGDNVNGALGRPGDSQTGVASAAAAADNDGLRCAPRRATTPTMLVLKLARASAQGLASSWSSPSQPQQKPMSSVAHVFGAEIATATLLVSLLPSAPIEHHPEESLLVALDVLSFVGAKSWIDESAVCAATAAATTISGSKPATSPMKRRHPSNVPEIPWKEVWPPELESLDLALLVNTAGGYLDLRLLALQALFEEDCQDEKGEEMASDKHQRRVHNACRLVVECTWLARLILRSAIAAGALDKKLRSVLSAQGAGDAMHFCGRALEMLQRCVRTASPRPTFSASSGGRPTVGNEGLPEESSPEVFLGHRDWAADMLLLTAPVAVDLTALLVALVRQPIAWGEDPTWATRTLGSTTSCRDGGDGGIIPLLVELLGQLVTEAPRKESDHQQRVGSERDLLQRPPLAQRSLPQVAEALEKRLTGGREVLNNLLVAVLHSIAAVIRRANVLIETSQDTSQGVHGSAAAAAAGETAETARVDWAQEETTKAVSRVARGAERAFQPGGPVLTILEAQLPPKSLPHSAGTLFCRDASSDTHGTGFHQSPQVASTIPIPCLTAALRLSTVFFSLRGRIRDEAELVRPEEFVGPLFAGFRQRWDGGLVGSPSPDAIHAVPSMKHGLRLGGGARQEQKTEGEKLVRPDSKNEISLCRLNLEALVELATARDPAVLQRLDECRVAPFLLHRVLAVGGRADRTHKEDPVESLSAVQGPGERQPSPNRSGMTNPAPQTTRRRDAGHGGSGSGNGSGDTPGLAKPPGIAAAPAPGRVLLHAAGFSVSEGDRVEGLVAVKSGRPRWFPGRVGSVNGDDGTVHVCYDDGDEERNKDPGEVRPSRRRRPTDRARGRSFPGVRQHSAAGKEAPVAAAPATSSTDTALQQGGKILPGTDDTTLEPVLIPDVAVASVDGPGPSPTETLGKAAPSCKDRGSGKCGHTGTVAPRAAVEGARQEVIAETSVAAVSEGNVCDPESTVSSAGGSGNSAENDSEDDDAYFVIPSVLDAAAAAGNSNTRFPPAVDSSSSSPGSAVPRIDLQSPVFRTRVFSSQLGPGSSLSTPTAGGGRALDTLRDGRESRSEAWLSTPASTSRRSSRSSQAPRPPSFIARSLRGWERQMAGLVRRSEEESSSSEEEGEEGGGEFGSSTSEALARCPTRQVSRVTDDVVEPGQGHPAAATTAPGSQAGAQTVSGEDPGHLGNGSGAATKGRQQGDDLRVIKGLAVTLLLSMATTPGDPASLGWGHNSPPALLEGSGKQETADVAREMTRLQEFFDDDRNASVVPSLRVQWQSRAMSTAESTPAVLAKLACAALFDSQSYSLDGDHISAGRFGGIIVSECPLRLGGARCHRASARACGGTSAMGRLEEPETPATLPPLASSSPSDSRCRVEVADDDTDADVVALKVVERDELDSAIGANVFVEVLALGALADVDGVCHLYDFGVTPASYVLVLERCVGSLKEWRLARSVGHDSGGGDGGDDSLEAPRSEEEAALYLLVFRQIVSTVAAMAERGVIHFDLKCENILVRRGGGTSGPPFACPPVSSPPVPDGGLCAEQHAPLSVCVADFGESIIGRRRRLQTVGAGASDCPRKNPAVPVTDENFFFDVRGARGTERIQSPEMVLLSGGSGGLPGPDSCSSGAARGETEGAAGGITAASDVWSLGCLLYELLSKQLLFGDLQWSEFFVLLTAGAAVAGPPGGNGDAGMVRVHPTPPTPMPPPRSLRPFTGLDCAEALRQLLAAMLVRNPAKRPSAVQAVGYVDEALAAIASSISKKQVQDRTGLDLSMTIAVGERPPTDPQKVDKRTPASSHTPNTGAYGNVCWRSVKSEGNAETAGTEKLPQTTFSSTGLIRDWESRWENRLNVTTLPSAATLAPLRPCVAVAAHRKLDAERLALLGCDGCLHRLGAGAFILTGPAGDSNGNSSQSIENTVRSLLKTNQTCVPSKLPADQELSAWPQLGPQTKVWCSAADCHEFALGGDNMKPGMEEAGVSRCAALGSVLPSLGISHVVCVLPKRGEATTAARCCSSATTKQNASWEPQPPIFSQISKGSRLLRVLVPVEEEEDAAEEGEEGQDEHLSSRISAPRSMAGVVRDVLEFATGPRVLFVGGDNGCGYDVAGALALVWAMARTGKGSYEAMIDFRQRCAGFYVDETILRLVLG